eukprot:TRINITY_DN4322_c0_g1_i1.p1 TRINITY_DN4322_c0_g1~~TRINITY_DN4322_c0_g1_i1.p1  ORF type:complete len:423 (+),score=95.03 TRINITY_DN4322_c0_g1_i1:272-1540(+)
MPSDSKDFDYQPLDESPAVPLKKDLESGGVPPSADSEKEQKPYRLTFLVTLSVFMGYAILVSFQHKIKAKLHIPDDKSHISHEFSFAVSFLYIGNLIFRLAHNFLFAFLVPRQRVTLSMCSMICSMTTLAVFVFINPLENNKLLPIYFAYAFGGISVGSFESNMLSTITPLGHDTKVWTILGMPLGFSCILIGGFAFTALGIEPVVVYFSVICFLIVGLFVFHVHIPNVVIKNNSQTFGEFTKNLAKIPKWGPKIVWNSLSLMVDMFFVSVFSAVMFYILDDKKVIPILGDSNSTMVPHDWYFVVYNCFTLAGDSLSRKVAYKMKPLFPGFYLILSITGGIICCLKQPLIAPIGIFMVFYANGAIYATTTRHIDNNVPKQFNLIALSFWLFVGDIGSVTGSNIVPYLHDIVCSTKGHHICVK